MPEIPYALYVEYFVLPAGGMHPQQLAWFRLLGGRFSATGVARMQCSALVDSTHLPSLNRLDPDRPRGSCARRQNLKKCAAHGGRVKSYNAVPRTGQSGDGVHKCIYTVVEVQMHTKIKSMITRHNRAMLMLKRYILARRSCLGS